MLYNLPGLAVVLPVVLPAVLALGCRATSQVQCMGKASAEGLGLGAVTKGCGGNRFGAEGCFWKWE